MLMEDDFEDAFNIINIPQNIIKRLLNHLSTGRLEHRSNRQDDCF
jgi:hypothetical protein